MLINSRMITFSVIGILFSLNVFGKIIDELTEDQIQKITAGQQVYTAEKVAQKPWPKLRIYQVIHSSPEEATAVTMDWELKASYTKGLKRSKISKIIDPVTTNVEYVAGLPILGSETFVIQNKISTYDNEKYYRVDSKLVQSEHMKQSDSIIRFEEFNGETLMALETLTDPNRPLAGMVASYSVNQTLKACDKFEEQVSKEKKTDNALLENQISALREALRTTPFTSP